ncbi:Uncharacterized protein APZ42_023374 [Daphnia magna]|uniref:Uncharacterized protein n=1 Tax=Daphnia magna TaxID=35525 RepID=A0A164V0C6_9CRUS|nr:Uncharacterized protein APZ42_023374 [Daphnia magna]
MMMMRHHHHHQDRGRHLQLVLNGVRAGGKRFPARSNDECNFVIRLDYYTQLVWRQKETKRKKKYPTDLLHSSCEITDSLLQFRNRKKKIKSLNDKRKCDATEVGGGVEKWLGKGGKKKKNVTRFPGK